MSPTEPEAPVKNCQKSGRLALRVEAEEADKIADASAGSVKACTEATTKMPTSIGSELWGAVGLG